MRHKKGYILVLTLLSTVRLVLTVSLVAIHELNGLYGFNGWFCVGTLWAVRGGERVGPPELPREALTVYCSAHFRPLELLGSAMIGLSRTSSISSDCRDWPCNIYTVHLYTDMYIGSNFFNFFFQITIFTDSGVDTPVYGRDREKDSEKLLKVSWDLKMCPY